MSIFQVFFAFHAISKIKKKIGVKKKKIRGGGVDFFFRKTILSHFTFYAIFNITKNNEKCPFTYWLNGRWFLQIVERDSWNLYPSSIPLFLFCISNVWVVWGGGGVMFFSHFMLFPTFLEKNLGIQNNYFSFNVFFVFFFVCWKYCKVPLHFLEKQFFLISRFMLFSTLKKPQLFLI